MWYAYIRPCRAPHASLTLLSGNERPCKRCHKRGIPCLSDSLSQVSHGGLAEDNNATQIIPIEPLENDASAPADAGSVNESIQAPVGMNTNYTQEQMYSIAPLTEPVEAWPQLDFDHSFPSFFESIMVPESNWVGAGEVQMPPDLATVIPDYEEWPGSSDIFGFDFSAAFEQAMDPSQAIDIAVENQGEALASGGGITDASTDTARQRHAIFKRSQW